jgi:fructokinase
MDYSRPHYLKQVCLVVEYWNSSQKLAVLCAGEALIDLVANAQGQLTPCLGGAVYNLARALALQGVRTGYLNPLSSDFYGAALRTGLVQCGVQLLEPASVPKPTSLAIARLDEQGKADYAFYREGVADRDITARQLNRLSASAGGINDKNSEKTIVCTGCLALNPDDASAYLPWLAEQKRLGRLVAIDINIRAAIMKDHAAYKANIHAALQHADIIKASDDDLAFLNISAAELLQQTQAQIFLLTLGAKGAQALTINQGTLATLDAQAPSGVQVIDTVGAGDCFFAGFLAHWLQPESKLQAALEHAVRSASISVSRQGCQPPTWDEVASVTAEPETAPRMRSVI